MSNVQVRALVGVCIGPEKHLLPGEVGVVDKASAQFLVAINKVELVAEEAAPAPAPAPAVAPAPAPAPSRGKGKRSSAAQAAAAPAAPAPVSPQPNEPADSDGPKE